MSECSAKECRGDAIEGGRVCERHGGLAPQVQAAAAVVVAERSMAGLVQPLRPTDRRRHPGNGLHREYEATVARIAWLEDRVAELTEAEATWGKTKHETAGGFEGGSNTTFEARLHPWLVLLDRERKHLIDVEKVLASKKFTDAEAAINDIIVTEVLTRTRAIVKALERKPEHPKTRQRMAEVFGREMPELHRAAVESLLDVILSPAAEPVLELEAVEVLP